MTAAEKKPTRNARARKSPPPVDRTDVGGDGDELGHACLSMTDDCLKELAHDVASECIAVAALQRQQKLIFRARLMILIAVACLAPAVALEPNRSTTTHSASTNPLSQAHHWVSTRFRELPPPAQHALAGVGMFAAVMLPPVPLPLPARAAIGVAAAGIFVHQRRSGSKRPARVELSSTPRPEAAMERIEARVAEGSLLLHNAGLVREWAADWAAELATGAVRSTPALMLLGDASVGLVVRALRETLLEGGPSWTGSHPGVLELDTRSCPGAECTDQIEAFMVARTKAKQPGLLVLTNADGFEACPELETTRRRCEANSERWSDMMGALEKFVEPSVGGAVDVAAPGCPPLGCSIRPNQFALLITAQALDSPGCQAMYQQAAGDSSSMVRELRKLRARMWDPNNLDADRAATVPAIANRIGRAVGLACAAAA